MTEEQEPVPGAPIRSTRRNAAQQVDLFSSPGHDTVSVAPAQHDASLAALAASLPTHVRLGTSSWAFPGWKDLVYAQRESTSRLSRYGLGAYAQHPLLRAVGLDRTFYAPIGASAFAEYAAAVPEDFRFLVKAHAALTTSERQRTIGDAPAQNVFLDAGYAAHEVIAPAVEGLGSTLGVILFQFPPLSLPPRQLAAFPEQLARFLAALPRGVPYAVEVRDAGVLTAEYAHALREGGATHCYNVHPRMPDVLSQAACLGAAVRDAGPVAVRWMLRTDQQYASAKEAYAPFDQLVAPDPARRAQIAELLSILEAEARPVIVIANNKAEGSAPRTLIELARLLANRNPDP